MEKNYSMWERIKSDTPTFFKKMQLFSLGLAALGTSLSAVTGVPAKLTTIFISIGTTIAMVAQFAVKQYEPLKSNTNENK